MTKKPMLKFYIFIDKLKKRVKSENITDSKDLMDIMEEAGELDKRVDFNQIVDIKIAEKVFFIFWKSW